MSEGLESIGEGAFSNWKEAEGEIQGKNILTKVTIPSTVTSIDKKAFSYNGLDRNSGNITIEDGGSYPGPWELIGGSTEWTRGSE